MKLTTKDLITGILSALAVLVYYAHTKGVIIPQVSDTRAAIAAVGVLGFVACAIGGVAEGKFASSPMVMVLSGLGVVALLLIVAGLISGKESLLTLLVMLIAAMWILTTVRHTADL